jgi:predicted regulator of Ras-like GTPase activity (Roadblock/LC7/MglB family)
MFEFLRSWRTNSRIRNLEAQLQGHPTPGLYLQLADAYREAENPQKAAQVLKLGAVRFPNSPEISRRQMEAERVEREHEKRRLHDKIQTHPNPILYARLAELYKADNDKERTVQICQAGIKAFPRYGGTYLVLGQVYVEKESWTEAMGYLEKAIELDKYNYMALKLLAQVYLKLGRAGDAVRRLEDILYFAPGDEAILELLKRAREAGGQLKPMDTTVIPRPERDVTKIARPVGQLLPRKTQVLAREGAAGMRDRALNERFAQLRGVDGVQGGILVDQYGLVVAANLDASLDEGLAGALITNVYRTASGSAVKLGVGAFEEGVIEAETGYVHIVQCGEMILAVFAQPTVKLGLLEQRLRQIAELVLEPKG